MSRKGYSLAGILPESHCYTILVLMVNYPDTSFKFKRYINSASIIVIHCYCTFFPVKGCNVKITVHIKITCTKCILSSVMFSYLPLHRVFKCLSKNSSSRLAMWEHSSQTLTGSTKLSLGSMTL